MFMIGSFAGGMSSGLSEGYDLGRKIKGDVIAQRNADANRAAEEDAKNPGFSGGGGGDVPVIDRGPQTGQPGTSGGGSDWYKPGEAHPSAPPPGTKVDISKLPKAPAVTTGIGGAVDVNQGMIPPWSKPLGGDAASDASAGIQRPPDRGGAADSSAGVVNPVGVHTMPPLAEREASGVTDASAGMLPPPPLNAATDASAGVGVGRSALPPPGSGYSQMIGATGLGGAVDAGVSPLAGATAYQGASPGAAYDASGSPLFGATAYEGSSPGAAYDMSQDMVGGRVRKQQQLAAQRAARAQAPRSTAGAPGYPGTAPAGTSTMRPGYAMPGTALPIDPRTGLPLLPQSQAIGPSALPAYPYDSYATPVR